MLANDHGAAMVFLAVILVVLLSISALAIDLGKLYIAKQRAQNVADAAAEGGAASLTGEADCTAVDSSSGERTGGDGAPAGAAKDIAKANNDAFTQGFWHVLHPDNHSPGILVSFPTGPTITGVDGTTYDITPGSAITVEAAVPVEFGFAKVMGFTGTRYVTASATAVLVSDSYYVSNIISIGVDKRTITENPGQIAPGTPIDIKFHNWASATPAPIGAGEFGPIVLPGDDTGNTDYEARIRGQYDDGTTPDPIEITEPMYIDTNTGARVGPTDKAFEDRLAGDDWTYDAWMAEGADGSYPETSRVVLLPILQPGEYNGSETIEVVGFAAFFIESSSGQIVTGRFLESVSLGDMINGVDSPYFDTDSKKWTQGVKLIK
jgi:hypothetical protein